MYISPWKSAPRQPADTFPHQPVQEKAAVQLAYVNTATLHRPGKVWRNLRVQDERSTLHLTQQSGSAEPRPHLPGSPPELLIPGPNQSAADPTLILFVQINNEIAAAPHGGTQRVVIAAFQAGSDGLCGRLARLRCDLVCVCNFPEA